MIDDTVSPKDYFWAQANDQQIDVIAGSYAVAYAIMCLTDEVRQVREKLQNIETRDYYNSVTKDDEKEQSQAPPK